MDTDFEKIKDFLLELEYTIKSEDKAEELFIIEKEETGITNMVIDCESPILIFEQFLFEVKNDSSEMYKALLMKNRDIIHGAFVLTNENKLMFRDTLQVDNLDLNEFQATLNALEILLSEYANELIAFSKI